jgi:hypothetical protein
MQLAWGAKRQRVGQPKPATSAALVLTETLFARATPPVETRPRYLRTSNPRNQRLRESSAFHYTICSELVVSKTWDHVTDGLQGLQHRATHRAAIPSARQNPRLRILLLKRVLHAINNNACNVSM